MSVKLLLEVGLGVDGSTQSTHRSFEFPAATCADCNDGRRAEPLDDSKIALSQEVVPLNHDDESLTESIVTFNLGAPSPFSNCRNRSWGRGKPAVAEAADRRVDASSIGCYRTLEDITYWGDHVGGNSQEIRRA